MFVIVSHVRSTDDRAMKELSMLVMVAALAFGACKKSDAPTGAGDPPAAITSDDDFVKLGMAMSNDMIAVFKADGSDCNKLADDLAKVMPIDKLQLAKAYETAHPDVKKKLTDASAALATEFAGAAGPALSACQKNQKLIDLMAKLNK
jgi:hypothetical protein